MAASHCGCSCPGAIRSTFHSATSRCSPTATARRLAKRTGTTPNCESSRAAPSATTARCTRRRWPWPTAPSPVWCAWPTAVKCSCAVPMVERSKHSRVHCRNWRVCAIRERAGTGRCRLSGIWVNRTGAGPSRPSSSRRRSSRRWRARGSTRLTERRRWCSAVPPARLATKRR